MKLWVDAQISPFIVRWIRDTFSIECYSVRELGLRDATDRQIFLAAKEQGAVVMTFVDLVNRFGAPPQVLWITSGNTSNTSLRAILTKNLPAALRLLETGDSLVEISDQW